MEFLALILAVVAVVIAHNKQGQIDRLTRRVQSLETGLPTVKAGAWQPRSTPGAAAAEFAAEPSQASEAHYEPSPQTESGELPEREETRDATAAETEASVGAEAVIDAPAPQAGATPLAARGALDLEKAIGVHLPIWGGAIMLLIAGFFLARMAADNGFFTPTLGVIACAIGAAIALAAAFTVRSFKITNHAQIAAALASASVGTLYATAFMSSAAFGLTTLFTGFLLTAGTAALALGIAFLFGRPVLVVGLLGGYLAPCFLFGDAPQELVFHLYLAALLVAGTATCVRQGWLQPLLPMLALHFCWLTAFLLLGDTPIGGSILTMIAIIATPIAVFVLADRRPEGGAIAASLFATSAAMTLLVLGARLFDFSPLYLSGFAVLVAATALMTLFGRAERHWPTIIAVLGWLILVALWREPDGAHRLLVVAAVLAGTSIPLVVWLLRGRRPTQSATLLCMVTAATFVSTMIDLDGWVGVRDLPLLWGALALLFSALAVLGAIVLADKAKAEANTVRGIFSGSASAFISLAVVAIIDPSYFALAAALQVLGISLVFRRYPANHLLVVAAAYLIGYFALVLVSIPAALGLAELGSLAAYVPNTLPWDSPIVALLLPAVAFLLAATVLGKAQVQLVARLDASAVLLAAAATTFLILPARLEQGDALVWSSLWGNAMLAIGLAALAAGGRLERFGLRGTGLALSVVTVGVIGWLVVMPVYSLWPEWRVPGLPLVNVTLTGLAVPGVLALLVAWLFRLGNAIERQLRWLFVLAGGIFILSAVLVDIRHLFHPDLLQGPSGAIERYSYSAGMLAMAFSTLTIGARLDSQPLRYGSLVIMLATVAKVFLFDTGGLEGLWRVASFVAMGGALLATSWFYGRFVFGRRGRPPITE